MAGPDQRHIETRGGQVGPVSALPSAVDLKFLSVVPPARHRNFKSKNRTGIIKLLVHLLIPKFAREGAAK